MGTVPIGPGEAGPPRPGAIVRASGPRVVRDVAGPLVSFYLGWKLAGLAIGVVAATLVALAIFAFEQRRGRPAALARLALGLVFIRAGVGLMTGSPKLYLAQDAMIDVLLGSAFAVSLLLGRPITAVFAREIYPVPDEVLGSGTYLEVFRRLTFVWSAYFLACATVRLAVLLTASVDVYVVVAAATGAPVILGLIVWSVRYAVHSFRDSAEWGPAFAAAEAGEPV